jgi:hypothetical protein
VVSCPECAYRWWPQRINDNHAGAGTDDRNRRYSGTNVLAICVGGLLVIAGIAASFLE